MLHPPEDIVVPAGGQCSRYRRCICTPEGIVNPTGRYCCTYRRVMSRCRRALLRLPEGIVAPAGGYCCARRRALLRLPEGNVCTTGGYCCASRRALFVLPEGILRGHEAAFCATPRAELGAQLDRVLRENAAPRLAALSDPRRPARETGGKESRSLTDVLTAPARSPPDNP